MDPDRWNRLEAICHAALQRDGASRCAFLEDACGGDVALREEAEAVLAELEADPGFLETPLVRLGDVAPAAPAADGERTVGPYRLIRPLGRGGMGDVHLGVRDVAGTPQYVAVKVIRRGMDSEEVLRRFRQERRIVASLHHPNIAHLIDGGATDDGRPYFVMEYVEGEPIDAYARRHGLGVARRLQLVEIVCAALQHAHGNLVVHRDLKPSNLLVTADGVPKLLDFGIGKILGPEAPDADPETRSSVRVLTPEYASPEQVRGGAVTTATDVHGLGILLYLLLTGRHPFATPGRSLEEIERAIGLEEPPRPSRVAAVADRRRLAGDLDTIILKALRKEPDRRYASPAALADDLRRHLDGRPVAARPDTLRYRAGKFVRRNPWGVTAAAVTVTALAGVSVLSSLQSRRAFRERDAAIEVRSFLLESFGARGADRDAPVTARELLDQQAATLGFAYGDRPGLQAEMLQVVAEGYERLGLYDEAERRAREALAVHRAAAADRPVELAWAMEVLGWIRLRQGDRAEADTLLTQAVARFRATGAAGRRGLARALNDLGVLRQEAGDLDGAEAALAEALALRTRYFPRETRGIGVTGVNLAALQYRRGNYREAVVRGESALAAIRQAVGPDHQRAIIAQTNLATMRTALGDWAGAERDLRDLLERQSRIQGPAHPLTARVMVSLGAALRMQGKVAEAESLLIVALAAQERALGSNNAQVAVTLRALSQTTASLGQYQRAVDLSTRALAIQRAVSGPRHPEVAEALFALARNQQAAGNLAATERSQREAVGILDSALGRTHPRTATGRVWLSQTLNALNRPREALSVLGEAQALGDRPGSEGTVQTIRLELARTHLRLGAPAVAESLLAVVERAFPADSTQTAQRQQLGELRQELARHR